MLNYLSSNSNSPSYVLHYPFSLKLRFVFIKKVRLLQVHIRYEI